MTGKNWVLGFGAVGVALCCLLSCNNSDPENDCLHSDCSGTYCDVDADCASGFVCRPTSPPQGSPIGCVTAGGAGG